MEIGVLGPTGQPAVKPVEEEFKTGPGLVTIHLKPVEELIVPGQKYLVRPATINSAR